MFSAEPPREWTPEEKRVSFVWGLALAINKGAFLNSPNPLDQETNFALYYVAESWPNVTPELVESAWAALSGMFDGSNKAKAQAQWEDQIRSRYGE